MKIPDYRQLDFEILDTVKDGNLLKREYYKSFDGTNYIGLMVSEDYVDVIDAKGRPTKSTITVKYYKGGTEVGTETKVNKASYS